VILWIESKFCIVFEFASLNIGREELTNYVVYIRHDRIWRIYKASLRRH
jgi:hypothetical protein